VAFDEKLTEYSQRYEETQGFSPTFQRFHHALAEELVERHGLRSIKGYRDRMWERRVSASALCAWREPRPRLRSCVHRAREQQIKGKNVEIIADYFSPRYAVEDADFVVCKMTLEHISETGTFLDQIRESVAGSDDTVVFIQVPEATRIFRDCAFEDIYYEHCSYFTAASLATLMETVGFQVLRTAVTYGEQYLTVEARYGGGAGTLSRDSSAETAEWLESRELPRCAWRQRSLAWRDDIERRVRRWPARGYLGLRIEGSVLPQHARGE
jgi:hypothetical protein